MHQRNPISNFPIQFQIWIAQGLFVICVAPSFCLLPILTRPQINAWQWNNSCRQIFTNANIIFSHFLYKLQIFGWDFASTAWQSQQNMTAKGRHTVTKKKLSNFSNFVKFYTRNPSNSYGIENISNSILYLHRDSYYHHNSFLSEFFFQFDTLLNILTSRSIRPKLWWINYYSFLWLIIPDKWIILKILIILNILGKKNLVM